MVERTGMPIAWESPELSRYFRISSRSHHGLVFALALARAEREGCLVSIRSVAEETSISDGYLEELAGVLRAAGIVRGSRGRGGGYVLARPASEITVGMIIRLLDGPVVLAACQDAKATAPCPTDGKCASQPFFARLKSAIDRELDGMTLAELVTERAYV